MKRLALCLGLTTLTLAGFAAGRATAEADQGVTLVVRHTVANFDKWKVGYDGHESERKKFGWTSAMFEIGACGASASREGFAVRLPLLYSALWEEVFSWCRKP